MNKSIDVWISKEDFWAKIANDFSGRTVCDAADNILHATSGKGCSPDYIGCMGIGTTGSGERWGFDRNHIRCVQVTKKEAFAAGVTNYEPAAADAVVTADAIKSAIDKNLSEAAITCTSKVVPAKYARALNVDRLGLREVENLYGGEKVMLPRFVAVLFYRHLDALNLPLDVFSDTELRQQFLKWLLEPAYTHWDEADSVFFDNENAVARSERCGKWYQAAKEKKEKIEKEKSAAKEDEAKKLYGEVMSTFALDALDMSDRHKRLGEYKEALKWMECFVGCLELRKRAGRGDSPPSPPPSPQRKRAKKK